MQSRISLPLRRRTLLELLGGTVITAATGGIASAALPQTGSRITISDAILSIAFDDAMRTQISRAGKPLTAFDEGETLIVASGATAPRFVFSDHAATPVNDAHGKGTRHLVRGKSAGSIEKDVSVTFYDRHPGFAMITTQYRNQTKQPLTFAGWRNATHVLLPVAGGAWSYSGATHENRRDWVQPVTRGFDQRNFMGMNASDYGGGTPVVDVWRRDAGIAVGHIEVTPKLIALPVVQMSGGTKVGIESDVPLTLKPGETFSTHSCFMSVHTGDHFATLERYRDVMAERGIKAAATPATSYESIWCAWGYERNFTAEQIIATLPKAKSLGLEWAVLDDGWQTNEGDWNLDKKKFPRGDADMASFAKEVTRAGMKPRLWLAPLAVDPGSDLLHDHTDMLLLDKNGAVQDVTWWNAFTLCPAYAPVVEDTRKLITKIFKEWGYRGLKLDGQHLNGVAPCYNPAHNHARPEESVEKLQDFYKMIYDTAIAIDPEAVVELCPCGTAFAFHNAPFMNQTPSSDPLSSWQVRLKGKTMKGLLGRSAPYAGDHVELSDRGNDFASSYGIGAILSTKFTWPADTTNPSGGGLPPGGYVLTAEKEAMWRKWIALYNEKMLPTGSYLGGLYDIGFDKPETHVVAKDGILHYAFFADRWAGPVELRGLSGKQYRLTDGFTGKVIGTATAASNRITTNFERFLLIQATPVVRSAA